MRLILCLLVFSQFICLQAQNQKNETKKYAKKTYRFSAQTIKSGLYLPDSVVVSPIPIAHIWDEVDTLSGFSHSLGIIGKPVSNWKYGLPTQIFQNDVMENPWNRAIEPYMRYYSHEKTWFYDTRLPYSQLKFAQPGQKIQLLGIELAQNISPFGSIGGAYQRRTGIGAYLNQITDQWIFAVHSQVHSKNKKYWLFISGDFQQFSDQMNGGSFQDSLSTPQTSFEKFAQLVTLKGAISIRRTKGARADAMAWIIGRSDSGNVRLHLFAGADTRYFLQQYHDNIIESVAFRSVLNQPYPVFFYDSSQVHSFTEITQTEFHAGLGLGTHHGRAHFEIFRKNNQLKPDSLPSFANTGFRYQLQTSIAGIDYGISGFYWDNRLFKPEYQYSIQILKKWQEKEEILEDTLRNKQGKLKKIEFKRTYIPWQIGASYTSGSRQPSLQSVFYRSNTFEPLSINNALNSNYQLLRGFVQHTGVAQVKNRLPYLPNTFQISMFFSRWAKPQLPDSLTLQTQTLPPLSCIGLEWNFRQRLGRFYLESNQSLQKYIQKSGQWGEHIPFWYGKAAIFYENHFFKKAAIGRIGMDISYRGHFYPLRYSPDVSVFYAQNTISEKANIWLDLHISMQVKWATFFVKASNVLDQVLSPGYYSTLYYPMLHRNISFGIQWIFWE